MTIKIPQTTYEPIPTGEYLAKISQITNEDGLYGPQLKFTFDLLNQDEERTLLGWTSAKFSTKSKLFGWTKAALGGGELPQTKDFDSDELLGKKVILVVVEKQGDNGPFNKIDDVKPYRQPQVQPSASPPVWDE